MKKQNRFDKMRKLCKREEAKYTYEKKRKTTRLFR